MLARHFIVLAFGMVTSAASYAAGFVHNENFVVYCPSVGTQEETQAYAKRVLQFADQCRSEIAKQWLGRELPAGVGRTVINIEFSSDEDAALTWAKDNPNRRYHSIYLTASADKAIGSTLKHELTHAVLATRWQHPKRLPAWAEEGVASRYDDTSRITLRRQIVQWIAETGNWPQLMPLLRQNAISSDNLESYAVASSLTEFLLDKADKETFFQFAMSGTKDGWDTAVRKHYRMGSVDELARHWQQWVSQRESGITVAANL